MVREATHVSPSVLITHYELYCAGNFWMENPAIFFEELKREVAKTAAKQFNMRIAIESIHTSAIAHLFEFFRFIKLRLTFNEFEKCNVIVFYRNDDTDTKILIQDISKMINLDITLFALPEKKVPF
jgi:hypothetical protein